MDAPVLGQTPGPSAHPAPPRACPHCRGRRFIRHGRKGGVQRYRCQDCRRTFNARTRTFLARIRLVAQRLRFEALMPAGGTLREDAARLGVSATTVFRWRHQHLQRLAARQPRRLPRAPALVLDWYCLRAPRRVWSSEPDFLYWGRRPKPAGWIVPDATTVVFAAPPRPADGPEPFVGFVVREGFGRRRLEEALAERLPRRSRVHTCWGWAGWEKKAAGGRLRWQLEGERPPLPRPSRTLLTCFKRWMARFRGVALRYLHRYLAWFDQCCRHSLVIPTLKGYGYSGTVL